MQKGQSGVGTTGHVKDFLRPARSTGARTAYRAVGVTALLLAAALSIAGPALAAAPNAAATPGATAVAADDGTWTQTGEANATVNESEQFDLDADVVERCGRQCRTVTANLTNVGNETAYNVTTETTITTGDRVVWQRTDDLGNISANESVERTDDVRLGYLDVYHVTRNGGEIDIAVNVTWDGGNATFTEERRVG